LFLGPKSILDPNVTSACCQNPDSVLWLDLSVLTKSKAVFGFIFLCFRKCSLTDSWQYSEY